jgi:hypothetical protein
MITAYAPTDVGSINVSGGCGSEHKIQDDPNGGHGIACPLCSVAVLQIPSLGWSGSPHGVKLTVDENASLEEAKATGLTAQSLAAKAIGEKIAELVMHDSPREKAPAQKIEVATEDVLAALDGLPQDQLAALLLKAGLVSQPVDESVDEAPAKPVKRAYNRKQ